MSERVRQFNEYRRKMNERLLATDNRVLKRMFSLDSLTYADGGALDVKSKELMGASRDEIIETMSIGLVVGGTIVIPHMRRAVEFLDDLSGAEA